MKVRKSNYLVVAYFFPPDRVFLGTTIPGTGLCVLGSEPLSVCGFNSLGPAGKALIQSVWLQRNSTEWRWDRAVTERVLSWGTQLEGQSQRSSPALRVHGAVTQAHSQTRTHASIPVNSVFSPRLLRAL